MPKEMFTITGVEFRLQQSHLQSLLRKRKAREFMERVGQLTETEAKARCPVRTGNLRRSITHETYQAAEGAWVARVGTNVRYGLFQEIGTRNMPAHPYLRPAMEAVARMLKT